MINFKDKTAIITGAGQGIGAAIAAYLGQQGCRLVLIDVDEDSLFKLSRSLESEGVSVSPYIGSVTDEPFLNELAQDIGNNWGNIHILVNNAGIIKDNLVHKISNEDWDAVLDVNLKGPFLCCKAVTKFMKENNYGKIINIISRAWLGNIGQSNYSASKGGLVSLTRTLALELAKFQINVNGVAPGLIDTPMTQKLPDKVKEKLINMQPTGKMGSVNDIAAAVGFLASDQADFITGQILHVDGGKSCGLSSL